MGGSRGRRKLKSKRLLCRRGFQEQKRPKKPKSAPALSRHRIGFRISYKNVEVDYLASDKGGMMFGWWVLGLVIVIGWWVIGYVMMMDRLVILID